MALAGLHTFIEKTLFIVATAVTMVLLQPLLQSPGETPFRLFFLAASLWWLVVTLWILRYRPESAFVPGKYAKSVIGLLVLVPAWAALVALHGHGSDGPLLMLFAMSLTWVADIGAYFAGRRWGRVKLAPAISPGKSREGSMVR